MGADGFQVPGCREAWVLVGVAILAGLVIASGALDGPAALSKSSGLGRNDLDGESALKISAAGCRIELLCGYRCRSGGHSGAFHRLERQPLTG